MIIKDNEPTNRKCNWKIGKIECRWELVCVECDALSLWEIISTFGVYFWTLKLEFNKMTRWNTFQTNSNAIFSVTSTLSLAVIYVPNVKLLHDNRNSNITRNCGLKIYYSALLFLFEKVLHGNWLIDLRCFLIVKIFSFYWYHLKCWNV